MITRGIILAGGSSSRLHPVTLSISKHLLPIYDKPMIYYPLTTLMLAGVQSFLFITRPDEADLYRRVLGDGSQWGIDIHYATQSAPRGLAEALIIGREFTQHQPVAFALGDNIFYGEGLSAILRNEASLTTGATVFGYYVEDPHRYGVVEFSDEGKAISIEEKPTSPKSSYAVPGLYFYGPDACDIAAEVKPSARGELEITSVNQVYLERGELNVYAFGRGIAWWDTGTHEALLDASNFVATIQRRQGLQIASPEEVAFRLKLIDEEALMKRARSFGKSHYSEYLLKLVQKDRRYFT